MAKNWSYDRLLTPHVFRHDQDITELSVNDEFRDTIGLLHAQDSQMPLRRLSSSQYAPSDPSPYLPQYDSTQQHNGPDSSSRKSSESFRSTATGSSTTKLKNLLRRRPLPKYLRGSIRRHAAADIEPARVGRGIWKDQLLSDRSFRTMAMTMSALALGMIILIACNIKHIVNRTNVGSTSVGGEPDSCKRVTHTNTACLLFINVCATMVLGMSNTYQQIVTSLKISDLRYALSKFGDSRVGTNSPLNIQHKEKGKKRAWAAWFLLIFTSMPVHFLANSLIGPSYTQELPEVVEFSPVDLPELNVTSLRDLSGGFYINGSGKPHYPIHFVDVSTNDGIFDEYQENFDMSWRQMRVHYTTENCTQHKGTIKLEGVDALEKDEIVYRYSYPSAYRVGDCSMGKDVICTLHEQTASKCRLNVRMSAAFVLMGCLVIKAVYMCAVNLLARGKVKQHCLTFGDVIVASAADPELRLQGECMVNATDSFRRLYSHTCHKHCFNHEESKTGDEIGHCQKCKKWNTEDKFANLPQPTIATKIKKSLISNLGNTALTQMLIMMFCSLALLTASLATAVILGSSASSRNRYCQKYGPDAPEYMRCHKSSTEYFESISGGFGGFNRSLTLTSLTPDNLSNEFIAFGISNAAQFIYSLLYLMMIYNITLISQESDWGKLEYRRKRIRTTLVSGTSFNQTYLLQLPKKILFPIMAYSTLTHWMLGEALQAHEAIWIEYSPGRHVEHSKYILKWAAYPLWFATFLILLMTAALKRKLVEIHFASKREPVNMLM
ncbi:unnamed protein product [Alternaria alternata]